MGAGGTSGSLGTGAVTDNASLTFDRSDNMTVANGITGSGSVTKLNINVLTLTGNNGFGGGLTVNAGTVRLSTTNAAGTGTLTINGGGTAVLATNQTVAGILLAGGTLSSSANLNPLTNDVTAAASTTSAIAYFDPNNPAAADPNEMNITGTLHGSGTITLMSVTNDPSPDSGNAFACAARRSAISAGRSSLPTRSNVNSRPPWLARSAPPGLGSS